MTFIQVAARDFSPRPSGGATPLEAQLHAERDKPGPVIVMIHGYKFSPGHRVSCPHRHILSLDETSRCWKAKSWPRALGFGTDTLNKGIGIGFGWHARGSIWQAYRAAADAGAALACIIERINRLAPQRALHLFCHSLGARVALASLPHLPRGAVDRVVMLNPAEFSDTARNALSTPAGMGAEFINVTSRENDLFDFLMERLMSLQGVSGTAMSHAMPRQRNTLTIQIDKAETLLALARAGFHIASSSVRVCHWSAYLRPGVFELYGSLLREPGRTGLPYLKTILPSETDPRWSRLLPLPDFSAEPAQRHEVKA